MTQHTIDDWTARRDLSRNVLHGAVHTGLRRNADMSWMDREEREGCGAILWPAIMAALILWGLAWQVLRHA